MKLPCPALLARTGPDRWRGSAPRPSGGSAAGSGSRGAAFTLVEILIAMGIFSMVLASIYSTWTAILRASKVGKDAAAAVQRARVAARTLEESLGSAESFALNQDLYGFVAQNGDDAYLSFVARLAKSFPRSGKFGDLDVRRVTFSIESAPDNTSQRFVLRQSPLLMDLDTDEREHPVVLAKNVKEFKTEFWDSRQQDWIDEWKQTNQLPALVRVTLKLATDNPHSSVVGQEVTRIVSLPAVTVQPGWQMPMRPGAGPFPGPMPVPGGPGGQGQPPPGVLPPGGGVRPQ